MPLQQQQDVYHWRLHVSLILNEAVARLDRMEAIWLRARDVNGGRRVDGPVEALPQPDDFSDHRDDRGLQASGAADDVGQRPDAHLLRFRRPPADQGHRSMVSEAAAMKAARRLSAESDGHQQ